MLSQSAAAALVAELILRAILRNLLRERKELSHSIERKRFSHTQQAELMLQTRKKAQQSNRLGVRRKFSSPAIQFNIKHSRGNISKRNIQDIVSHTNNHHSFVCACLCVLLLVNFFLNNRRILLLINRYHGKNILIDCRVIYIPIIQKRAERIHHCRKSDKKEKANNKKFVINQ